jgi:hypothetical protein
MKPTKTATPLIRNSINRAPLRCGFHLIPLALALFASTGTAQHLDRNSGVVLANPKIHNVYMDFSWDSDNPAATTADIDGFTRSLVNSTYFNSASQYGVGAASFTGHNEASIFCPPPIIGGITDFFAISTWMQCMTTNSPIPCGGTISGIPAPDNNTVYAVYVPSGTRINDVLISSCDGFAAYHFTGNTLVWKGVCPFVILVPQNFAYTVVPMDCAAHAQTILSLPGLLDGVSFLASHELIEASTDPIPTLSWIDNSQALFNGDILKKGEAADICEDRAPVQLTNGPLVAAYWSNGNNDPNNPLPTACVPIVDTTPPLITALLSPMPNAAGWNGTNVMVTFTATDNEPGGTGVKEIHFTLAGAQVASSIVSGSSALVIISTEGSTIVTFFAIDNAGIQDVPKTVTVRIDRTPPQSMLTIGFPKYPSGGTTFVTAATPFTLSATDSFSGVQNVWYRVFPSGSANPPAYTSVTGSSASFNVSGPDGVYEVDTFATDNAGNNETPHSQLVAISTASPPSGSTCNGVYGGNFNGNLTVANGQVCTIFNGAVKGNVTVNPGGTFNLNDGNATGNIRLQDGGNLTLSAASVGGNVQINGGGTFTIGPGATINKNLEIHNIPPGAAHNQICGSNIKGNLQFHNNGTAVDIGAMGCAGNVIGGNLQVQNNTAATNIFGNTVGGNLQCNSNAPKPAGGSNSAKAKQGQCSSF